MCRHIPSSMISQPQVPTSDCAARRLGPKQRRDLGVQAFAGAISITDLAEEAQVSRKFVYQQQTIVAEALDAAFDPGPNDDKVLFYLPVTKNWLRQFVLALVLLGHCQFRGILEILRDCFDFAISLGTIHNIVRRAAAAARQINSQQDLSGVRIGAHDEIFQHRKPVLVGVDAQTSYCYLLRLEANRDGDTWGVHLLDLCERGLKPDAVVGDAGSGLRAGLNQALSEVPFRGDVFHALREFQDVARLQEQRAYKDIKKCTELEGKIASRQYRGLSTRSLGVTLMHARKKQAQDIELSDDITCLADWFRWDVLALAGPCLADRCQLFDFIVAELEARASQAERLINPLVTYLKNQRDDLLHFAGQIDREIIALADANQCDPALVRELFNLQILDANNPQRWRPDARLRQILGKRYFSLNQALDALRHRIVRASSVVENINSRLRDYFFLRQNLDNDNEYLDLLQFYFNHHRFLRSEHPERVNRSPAELLTGKTQRHWLEQLGYTRFSRN
jgi:hypothetical protein